MNVASKKRGLFFRSSKAAISTSANNATSSSASINDHQEENGKALKAPSSPSGTSHHMNELDEDRFNGDGVQFQGKLIGHEYVAEARGEQMCQQSLKKLKIIQKALGGHKRKVNMYISFDGIKILDPQTNEELFHHSVPQISFISRDETDTRAFGYVFGNSQTGHQFIGIKTKKEAMVVMSTIGQLFAITLKRKRNAEQEQAVAAAASSTSPGEEHLYHSVQDQSQQMEVSSNDLSSCGTKTTRARIRHNTKNSSENVPIPALPPPTEQHPRHRQHGNQQTSLQQQDNRFATIGHLNDINNNTNFQHNKQSSSSALINEMDFFQSSIATRQHLGTSIDSSLPKDLNQNQNKSTKQDVHRLATSYDWAHFDDDHNQTLSLSREHDDSTLNTISSISDTLTYSNNQQTLTMNDSVTLVAGQQQQFLTTTNNQFHTNNMAMNKIIMNSKNKLNSSSTTISSSNFDGMDPFSDAFGSDPFSTASTTADISSNLFSAKTTQQQPQNRPPSNPSPTMFDSNKMSFKNSEINTGSVPALTNSFGSLSMDKLQQKSQGNQNSNSLFKSNVELSKSNQNSQADKYAVLHDINSISTSIFDSLGGNRKENINKENGKNIKQHSTPTPPPEIAKTMAAQQQQQFHSIGYPSHQSTNYTHQADNFNTSMIAPTSFCNVSYQQQLNQPISYTVNGVVVLPPVSNNGSMNYNAQANLSKLKHYSAVMSTDFAPATSTVMKNQWLTKSFDSNETQTGRNSFSGNQRQAPRAEFDSMSNLSSTSSNTSSNNNNYNPVLHQKGLDTPKKTANVGAKQQMETTNSIPLFQELDPFNKNKNSYSPSNFSNINDNRNRSPMPNLLNSSLSSMNSSNSSLFNSRNCSTPSSLHRRSPQLLSQHSLPTVVNSTSKFLSNASNSNQNNLSSTATTSSHIQESSNKVSTMTPTSRLTNSNNSNLDSNMTSTKLITSTTTATMTPNPHYIMLYDLNTAVSAEVSSNIKVDNEDPDSKNKTTKNNDLMAPLSQNFNAGQESVTRESNDDFSNGKDNMSMINKLEAIINKETLKTGLNDNKHHSRTSSISSSNSLLLQQEASNFSELKFDDVFESPLLTTDGFNQNHNDNNNNNLNETKSLVNQDKSNSGHPKLPSSEPVVTKSSTIASDPIRRNSPIKSRTESVSSLKSDSGIIQQLITSTTSAGQTRTFSRQSSTCSTPPAVPPRTDLLQHSNKYPNHHHIAPPPPLPPPHSNHPQHHSSPYGHRHYPHYQQAYPYPYYPSPPPPSSGSYGHPQDPYSDALRHRPNSSHHRYHSSYYDSWYGPSQNDSNHIYGPLASRPPLDYPPQIPPPPIPPTSCTPPIVSSGSGGYHGGYPDYHFQQQASSRPFSTSDTPNTSNNWHEYYLQQHYPTISFIHPHQSPLMSSSTLPLSTTTLSSGAYPPQQAPTQDKTKVSTTKSPTCLSTPPPRSEYETVSPPPSLPNPQRRISSTSISLSAGSCATKASQQQPPTSATILHQTSSISTCTERISTATASIATTIPMYPPPPPPLMSHLQQPDPFYHHHHYYDDANKSASQFAVFNVNMEQMIMKYQPPSVPSMPLHHRNSPILPPYESPYGYGHVYAHPQYGHQYSQAARGRSSSGHLYSNQLDLIPTQPAPMSMTGGPPQYGGHNNSIGSNSSSNGSSSGYSSAVMPSMMVDSLGGQIAHRISPAHQNSWPSYVNHPPPTLSQPKQQSHLLWDSESRNSKLEFNGNLFEDNFASECGFEDSHKQEGFDTVKRINAQKNTDSVPHVINNKESQEQDQKPAASMALDNTATEKRDLGPMVNITNEDKSTESSTTTNQKNNNQDNLCSLSQESPEERNIFVTKDDPFEDDFFKS